MIRIRSNAKAVLGRDVNFLISDFKYSRSPLLLSMWIVLSLHETLLIFCANHLILLSSLIRQTISNGSRNYYIVCRNRRQHYHIYSCLICPLFRFNRICLACLFLFSQDCSSFVLFDYHGQHQNPLVKAMERSRVCGPRWRLYKWSTYLDSVRRLSSCYMYISDGTTFPS